MANPYAQYQKTQVQTASQGRLVLMCYDGCIRFLRMGMEAIDHRDYENAHNNFIRVQRIVNELRYSLNDQAGPEIAANLRTFYDYINHQVIQANIRKDKAICETILRLLEDVRDTWKDVFRQAEDVPLPTSETGGISVEG